MELSNYVPEITLVLQTIHHLFGIESAVFDTNAVLIAGSKKYLEIKGTTVHKPSIAEVIENDEVTALCPGKMESCVGCRFSSNCPATLELLKRITSEGVPVGVLSFSAFSEDEHDGFHMGYSPPFSFSRPFGAVPDLPGAASSQMSKTSKTGTAITGATIKGSICTASATT